MALKTSLEQKMEMFLANGALGRENAALRAELAAAREDSARLDALERLRLGLIPGMPKSKHDYWFVRTYNDKFGQPTGETLRETIDAAIKVVMNA